MGASVTLLHPLLIMLIMFPFTFGKKMTKHKHQIVAKLIICYHQFHTITFTLLATCVKSLVDD